MKILVLSEFFYPDKSSTPKVLTELSEDLVKSGIDVEVITSRCSYKSENKELKSEEEYKNIKIKRVSSTQLNRNKFWGRILNYITYVISTFITVIKMKDYDSILVVSNPPILPIIGLVINKLRKKPYIYLIHDIYPDIAVKVGAIKENGIIFRLMTFINKKIYDKASKIIVLGKDMKNNIIGKGVDDSKIEIITNWADRRKIYPVAKKNDLSIRENIHGTFNIVYTGNIGRFHDIETILETALELKEYKNIRFIFVGDGYKKRIIEEYIKANYLSNIILMDYKYGEDYNNLLNSSDIFISTLDKGIEGLGVPSKTYSYLAASKPIIAIMNESSEIGNLVESRRLGLRVDSRDVSSIVEFIKKVIKNTNYYDELVNNVCNVFESEYERNVVTKKFYNIINNL